MSTFQQIISAILKLFNNYFFLTWLGAICTHILSLYSDDFKGTIPFFKKLIPKRTTTFYFRLDFLILPLIGALLAFFLLDPVSLKSCFFAGLSWSGTLIALLKRNEDQIKNSKEK